MTLPIICRRQRSSYDNFIPKLVDGCGYCYNIYRYSSTASQQQKKIHPVVAPPIKRDRPPDDRDYHHRHFGIQVHPDSISSKVLPGNMVLKESSSGKVMKRNVELVYGYFWMIKDMQRTNDKPILTSDGLIPEHEAKVFPSLPNVQNLNNAIVQLPEHFVRKNRSHDATAQCTIVGISFRDFGYQQLQTWLEPIRMEYSSNTASNDRVEIVTINSSEGFLTKWLLRTLIVNLNKRNTKPEQYDTTFLYFASSNNTGLSNDPMEYCRDSLRMHNIMVGYIFVLDGLGRVRFAGSGEGSADEVQQLLDCTKQLIVSTPPVVPIKKSHSSSGSNSIYNNDTVRNIPFATSRSNSRVRKGK